MPKLESFWTPFIWTDNLKTACKTIAFYSVAMSFILITFIIYQMRGGDSTQLWNPLLEYDVRWNVTNPMLLKGLFFIIVLFILIGSSFMMIHGIHIGIRGWLLPWLYVWGIICFYQFCFGVWLLWAYYIYLDVVYYVIVDYLWMGYNIYCGVVVWSMYKIIEELQSPNIELLWP